MNLNSITIGAFMAIMELDRTFIETENYMGLAYFWNVEYKHYMRECSNYERMKVHEMLVKENLPLDGVSPRHKEIVLKGTRNGRGMKRVFGSND